MRRALLLVLVLGCDGPADVDPLVVPTPIDPATAGRIRGRVDFPGSPPPNPKLAVGGSPECAALHGPGALDGRLRNALVYVKSGLEKHAFAWPKEPVRIANRGCLFVPRVAAAQTHQAVEIVNEDPTDHNANIPGRFNRWLRGKGTSTSLKLREPTPPQELRCDIHPWMRGWLAVVPHPFFAVTGEDGAFDFRGLPPGRYVIAAWHETYGEKTRELTLGPSGDVDLSFTFP
jgi:hypothetical protein